ncbi:MAG: NUDIX domain-containing protein [Propionibacteriaceae bacterium]|jgi:8-oxo-dGTP pyrophosphatase MutT (NUDIX family)|nr:NUDIX domain-containing protein [Propionibacteriaceae bacterium]
MRIIGVPVGGGPALVDCLVGHGEDPAALLRRDGFAIRSLLSVTGVSPNLTVTAQVGARSGPWAGRGPGARRRGAAVAAPPRRQRVAAYAVALSERGLLATQFSDQTVVGGYWGLPGGGVEVGETAADAAIREVAEESGQRIALNRLIDLQSDHWVGPSPGGVVEDFHALRLIYAAVVPEPTAPAVRDIGGTTSAVRWVPFDRWRRLPWSTAARAVLMRHLERLAREWRTSHAG